MQKYTGTAPYIDIDNLDQALCSIVRACMQLQPGFPSKALLFPTVAGGLGLRHLMVDYTQIAALSLVRALNDP